MFKSKNNIFIIIILGIAIFTRFYNLNWGSPSFFHPDERNMASAVTNMKFPDLNPHFFAYGQFPLYLAYFSGVIFNWINYSFSHFPDIFISSYLHIFQISFFQAIFFLRFYSALSQVILLMIIYKIGKQIFPSHSHVAYYLLLATIFTPSLIQAAHFGTTESLLTLFLFITTYLSIKIVNNSAKWFDYLCLILTLGLSLGTKLTSFIFFPIPIFALFIKLLLFSNLTIKQYNNRLSYFLRRLLMFIKFISLTIFISFSSILISLLISPYNLWQYQEFIGALNYESAVALGQTQVFYTRQFINTPPVIFQLTKIFPYALGPVLTVLGIAGFLLMMIKIIIFLIKKLFCNRFLSLRAERSNLDHIRLYSILIFSFLIYFIPNSLMFTKWTRFMTPIFPFFAIFSTYFLFKIYPHLLLLFRNLRFAYLKFVYLFVICLFAYLLISPGISFFYQVYGHEDIRLTASRWIYQNLPANSHILSETGNVIDIPVSIPNYQPPTTNYRLSPVSFDFYHLDENPGLLNQLFTELEKSDYIFVPSRRIFANHIRLSKTYPLTAKYYDLLFLEKLGFVKIKEFDRFAKFSIFNFQFSMDDEAAEETWSVFDHPRIQIFKKIKPLTAIDYQNIFSL